MSEQRLCVSPRQVGSYGGRLRYTLSYVAGGRGTPLPDADVQITVSWGEDLER